MILKMFTIHDTVAKSYSGISLDTSEATAIRNFKAMINGRDGAMQFSAADYDLIYLGTYDTETGNMVPEAQTKVVNGSAVLLDAEKVRGDIDG